MAFDKDQWVASFEGQLAILRPHLTDRIMKSMSLAAWHSRGRKDEDPIAAAKAESKALDTASADKSRSAKKQGG